MRKIILTILFIAAVVAAWAQKPDKKTVKLEKRYEAPPAGQLPGDCGEEEVR